MKKAFWREDWFGGLLLSILFFVVATSELFVKTGVSATDTDSNLAGKSQIINDINTIVLTVPDWLDIVEVTCLILIMCYLMFILPRLSNIAAVLISFTLLGILLITQEILVITSSFLAPLFYPALLLITGNLYVFSKRLLLTKDSDLNDVQNKLDSAEIAEEIKRENSLKEAKTFGLPGAVTDLKSVIEINEKNITLGRYTIDREIGKGAMGIVYLGKDPKINRIVAIKTMRIAQEFEESEVDEVKARFFREAETAGRLAHPNIVTIYDVGEDHELAYIAMEYLKGHDLKRYNRSNKLLPLKNVIQIIILAAEALNYAHQQNVIHRDIKPGNIMFIPESATIKLTDFGIARITDSSKTKTGIVLGTPSYMSPEQLKGHKNLDGRTDLFSLGVMFYQLLCGELPFTGESMAALMVMIAKEPHRDISEIRPDLIKNVPVISQILNKVLEKDPENRYQTGSEFAIDLRNCLKIIKKK